MRQSSITEDTIAAAALSETRNLSHNLDTDDRHNRFCAVTELVEVTQTPLNCVSLSSSASEIMTSESQSSTSMNGCDAAAAGLDEYDLEEINLACRSAFFLILFVAGTSTDPIYINLLVL